MRSMALPKAARRGSVLTIVVLGLSLFGPPRAQGTHISVQEAVLRAKPAVALIVSEVSADVQVDCNGDRTRVAPTPFRETGTGWGIDARGYLITNGHVVDSDTVTTIPPHADSRSLQLKLEPVLLASSMSSYPVTSLI